MEVGSVVKILRSKLGRPVLDGYRDPYRVLIATILSQRTRDENTKLAAEALFKKYPDASSLSKAPLLQIEKLIRPSGFYHNKARTIKKVAKLVESGVPNNIDSLLQLPGVGRKTANCVLVYAYKQPAIPVDTHVHRISNRLGWVKTKTPEETEAALTEKIPKHYWIELNSLMVRLGQTICKPITPHCYECPITRHCAYKNKTTSPQNLLNSP